MSAASDSRRRRFGPAPLPAEERRVHSIRVRLTGAELERLDAQRALVRMQRGEYLRSAGLHRLPPVVPAINREQWAELARLAANLNQIARHLNEGRASIGDLAGDLRQQIDECLRLLALVRAGLIGAKHDPEDAEDEGED